MRHVILVLVMLLALGAGLAVATTSPATADTGARLRAPAAASGGTHTASQVAALHYLGQQIRQYQRETWRWQTLMGVARTDTYGRVLMELSVPDAKKAVTLWRGHAEQARKRAQHPPHLGAFLCIHRFEGSWTDTGAPYYGGLQMDYGFMRHYGGFLLYRKGTADHWTPLEQIWVAERAFRSGRGFFPWPNTARVCGLI